MKIKKLIFEVRHKSLPDRDFEGDVVFAHDPLTMFDNVHCSGNGWVSARHYPDRGEYLYSGYQFETLEEWKIAAQEEFEKRVRSYLEE